MRIGAQLYTVTDYCQTMEDFSESLKKVADIGYRYVQMSACCPCDGEWFDAELKKNGLECVVTHMPDEKLINETEATAAWHDKFGCRNIGLSYYCFDRQDFSDCEEFRDTFKPVAQELKEYGKYFMYHNHWSEFKRLPDGRLVLDWLCDEFAPDELGFIADTFWMQVGGVDPAETLRTLKGRIPVIHLKDYKMRPWLEFHPFSYFGTIGEGNLNFDRIFEAAQDAGTEYMLVEQDKCYGEDPFDCLRRSYDYLHSKGFE